jgi:hypothetical protein
MLTASHLTQTELSKSQWDFFVTRSPQSSIYAKSWYLDAVMSNWSAIVVSDKGIWQAVMPLYVCKKYGISYALQPAFSQFLGVLFTPNISKNIRFLPKKSEILQMLIDTIPQEIRFLSYNFSPEFDYFLPFLRNNFVIKPRMNLCLSLLSTLNEIEANFSTSVSNHLKKAQINGLQCREGNSIHVLVERMFQQKFIRNEREKKSLMAIWEGAKAHNCGFLLEVIGRDGQIHCSGLFLIEKEKTIYVASALNRATRHLGSNSLLILEAIKKSKSLGINDLDFKGSMIASVEQFFLGFNPRSVLYLNITSNKLNAVEKMVYNVLKNTSI